MTETPTTQTLQDVARLAAEAVTAALPDYAGQIAALTGQLAEQREQLTAARRQLDQSLAEQREQLDQSLAEQREQLTAARRQLDQSLAEQQEQLTKQLAEQRQQLASIPALLSNYARQLTDLQDRQDRERSAWITALADVRTELTAEIKLANLERPTNA